MSLVYFAEGRQGLKDSDLPGLGLGHLGKVGKRAPGQAPAQGLAPGLYFSPFSKSLSSLDGFRWEPYPGSPSILVGWDPESPPAPEELRRDEQLDGHEVELSDGRRWLVPVARYPRGDTPLPRRMQWDGKAWGIGEVENRFKGLWAGAERVWARLMAVAEDLGPSGGEVTIEESSNLAALALSLNYQVGPGELSLLGLLTTSSQEDVVLAVVDYPSITSLIEESNSPGNSDGPGCEPGPEVSFPDTPPPSPSSH